MAGRRRSDPGKRIRGRVNDGHEPGDVPRSNVKIVTAVTFGDVVAPTGTACGDGDAWCSTNANFVLGVLRRPRRFGCATGPIVEVHLLDIDHVKPALDHELS